ncbi:MAG: MATE family efflux transporter, partial [Chloroflexota bacterium]
FTSFGLVMVLNNCLNGVGDTWIPMLNTLVTLWGVQMPLAYILPKVSGLGVYGVRWAMQVALVARGIFFVVYFVTGRWKRTQV